MLKIRSDMRDYLYKHGNAKITGGVGGPLMLIAMLVSVYKDMRILKSFR